MSLMAPERRVHLCPFQVSFAPVTLSGGASGSAVRGTIGVMLQIKPESSLQTRHGNPLLPTPPNKVGETEGPGRRRASEAGGGGRGGTHGLVGRYLSDGGRMGRRFHTPRSACWDFLCCARKLNLSLLLARALY